ncbi:MAG TPA: phytanoyl-CoA dioxygenase family protein [Planctomycetota bacterium]|nr:phytanoyl-CoA dioxygenase family protein [Planctomycetota bacterium]
MSATATLPEKAPARKFDNGHYRKDQKFIVYDGPLENLPYPETFNLEAAIDAMFTDGFAIIPGVLTREEVAELRHKMDTSGGPDEQYDQTKIGWCFNKHLSVEYHKDPHFLRYIDRPGVVDIARAVLGGDCRIHSGTLWITGPGRRMPIHADFLPVAMPEEFAMDPRVRVPIHECVAQFYLDDLTADIGPTIVVPGSHMSGRAPDSETEWRGRKPKAAMLKAGDVLLFRFDCWHGAYSNTNKQGKRRYIMQQAYSHRRTETGYPPMVYDHYWNPEVIKLATPRQKQLLGGVVKAEEKKY